jgi:hypothetical protein
MDRNVFYLVEVKENIGIEEDQRAQPDFKRSLETSLSDGSRRIVEHNKILSEVWRLRLAGDFA